MLVDHPQFAPLPESKLIRVGIGTDSGFTALDPTSRPLRSPLGEWRKSLADDVGRHRVAFDPVLEMPVAVGMFESPEQDVPDREVCVVAGRKLERSGVVDAVNLRCHDPTVQERGQVYRQIRVSDRSEDCENCGVREHDFPRDTGECERRITQ